MDTPNNNLSADLVDVALEKLPKERVQPAAHPPIDDLSKRRQVRAVLARREADRRAVMPRLRVWRFAGTAALVVVGALVGWWVWGNRIDKASSGAMVPHRETTVAPPVAKHFVPRSRIALLHGEVTCDGDKVHLGSRVPLNRWVTVKRGEAAFSLPGAIGVGLSGNTAVRVAHVERGRRRMLQVEIRSGMALFSVQPQTPRSGFLVKTPQGTVAVTGTLFTVNVDDDGQVTVYLHKGSVVIESPTGEKRKVTQGHMALLGPDAYRVRGIATDPKVDHHLRKIGCVDEGRIFTELMHTGCDGDSDHGVPERDPRPSRKVRHSAPSSPATASSQEGAGRPSARALLFSARAAQRVGRFDDAAAALRDLIAWYPTDSSSRTALVLLGRLELRNLNQPKRALAHFGAYLEQPGPLAQEALYGKAQALRALGDGAAERSALLELVRRFPDGPAADAARERLVHLGSP